MHPHGPRAPVVARGCGRRAAPCWCPGSRCRPRSASTGSSFVVADQLRARLARAARRTRVLAAHLGGAGQAQRMASPQKRLYHNPSLATQVKSWKYVGENVGYGPDVATLFERVHEQRPAPGEHPRPPVHPDRGRRGHRRAARSGSRWSSASPSTRRARSTHKKTAAKPKPTATTSRAPVAHAATAGRAPAKRALPPAPATARCVGRRRRGAGCRLPGHAGRGGSG